MIALRLAAAAAMLGAGLPSAARDEPPLPVWDPEVRGALEESGWVPGAILLDPSPLPEIADSEPADPIPPNLENPTEAELADDGLPVSLVPDEFIADYFAARPETFLVDPQNLLGSEVHAERLGFLNYHADESNIDLYIYVFGGDQDIPTDVRGEETIERFFPDDPPAAVVFYFLGAPERSILYLSPSLTDVVSAPEQRRALQSSMMQAFSRSNAIDEFTAFTVQMSIRIYWMERMLGGQATGEPAADLAGAVGPLPPVGPVAADQPVRPPGRFDALVSLVPLSAALVAIALTALAGLIIWLSIRARYHFPDLDVEPRLGGPHAAGIGAVISFASAAAPPASQRDQVPEYLRRL
jgi:hypothetical protein